MRCPICLRDVGAFTKAVSEDGGKSYTCPECKEAVPLLYAEDYAEYPPIVFSLVGLRGHGKTVYLASLLYEFERVGRQWRDFTFSPLDESGLTTVREKQKALEDGQLPQSTPKVFPKPVILRLKGVPTAGKFHLLIYDTSGEAFERVSDTRQYAGYVSRSKIIVWLVSLADLNRTQDRRQLDDLLTRYVQGLRETGGNPKEQVLLLVVTKGDEVVGSPGLPEEVADFLQGGTAAERNGGLEKLSTRIESWLQDQEDCRNLVRRAREEFKAVKYCVVSALGSRPNGSEQEVEVRPRGVLVPLQWVASLELGRWPSNINGQARTSIDNGSGESTPMASPETRKAGPSNTFDTQKWQEAKWPPDIATQIFNVRKNLDAIVAQFSHAGSRAKTKLLGGIAMLLVGVISLISNSSSLERRFDEALEKGALISPANQSAYTAYQDQKRRDSASPVLQHMAEKALPAIKKRGDTLFTQWHDNSRMEDGTPWTELERLYGWAIDVDSQDKTLQARYYYAKGEVALGRGQPAAALTAFSKALQWDEKWGQAYNGMGKAYVRQKDFERAKQSYEKAMQYEPDWIFPWQNLGHAYLELKQFPEAERCFRKARDIDPKRPGSWYLLGVCFDKRNMPAEAIAHYQKALELAVGNDNPGFTPEKVKRRIETLSPKGAK